MNKIITHSLAAFVALTSPALADERDVVDLSQTISDGLIGWPGTPGVSVNVVADYEHGVAARAYAMGDGVGTNVDSPAHFVEGARSISDLGVEELVLPAIVVDASAAAAADADYALDAAAIQAWEAANGPIPAGSFVVVSFGWSEHAGTPAYWNIDEEGELHFPGLAAEAAELLLARDVAGVGIDVHSADPGQSHDYQVHRILLGADKIIVEGLAGLDQLPATGAQVVIGALPVEDAPQIQARVIGLLPGEHSH